MAWHKLDNPEVKVKKFFKKRNENFEINLQDKKEEDET